jgi:hypothetical protein
LFALCGPHDKNNDFLNLLQTGKRKGLNFYGIKTIISGETSQGGTVPTVLIAKLFLSFIHYTCFY